MRLGNAAELPAKKEGKNHAAIPVWTAAAVLTQNKNDTITTIVSFKRFMKLVQSEHGRVQRLYYMFPQLVY